MIQNYIPFNINIVKVKILKIPVFSRKAWFVRERRYYPSNIIS